jgi:hypothetical protein
MPTLPTPVAKYAEPEEVSPVVDAYGNCEAIRVVLAKNAPCVQMLVDVAEVVVPKLEPTEKRLAKLALVESVAQPNTPAVHVRY